MQFLYPIGLLALTSLIVPLVIHLWNVKESRTLKVGGIVLLGESTAIKSKSLRITDWLLLMLRLLLLILLVLVLAKPFIFVKAYQSESKGWVVIDKSIFPLVYEQNKKTIDSLLAKGNELHDFSPGFALMGLKDTIDLKFPKDQISNSSLLKQLNEQLPRGLDVHLFSDRKLVNWDENIPPLHFNLKLYDIDSRDTLRNWSALFNGRIYKASSTIERTTYTLVPNGVPRKLDVLIYPVNGVDAAYVSAALKAIGSYTQTEVIIHTNKNNNPNTKHDLIFWLSEKKPDRHTLALLKPKAKLFTYQTGKEDEINSTINLTEGTELSAAPLISSRVVPSNDDGNAIWTDGFGLPLVTAKESKAYTLYEIYTRLDQKWTGLVWDQKFVKALMPMVFGESSTYSGFGFENNSLDQRERKEPLFKVTSNNTVSAVSSTEATIISPYFWILALLVFILERALSIKKRGASE